MRNRHHVPFRLLVGVTLCTSSVTFGCIDGPGDAGPLPPADYDQYVERVQPILEERCGLASCHGTPLRPLEIYVGPHHRLNEGDASAALTEAELQANFDRTRSFVIDVSTAEQSPLVSEPLAVEAGGIKHDPGPVFRTDIDDEYVTLLEWVRDALEKENR